MSDGDLEHRAAAVDARDVVRHYGDHRGLNDFSLRIQQGSIFGILGPNGSGKSTFLGLLAGRSAPDSGSVTVLGRAPGPTTRRETGVVFQESALDALGSVGDNLELSGRLFGLSRTECRTRGERLLDELGLGGRYRTTVKTLSGGMRRRIEIVRALLHGPRLLLMDEPTTGIDAEEREVVWARLGDYSRSGATVILATNDLMEAGRVCTAAAFLHEGRVVGEGTPDALKAGLGRESIVLDWAGEAEAAAGTLSGVEGVASVDVNGGTVQLAVNDAALVAPRLFAAAGGSIVGLRIRQATLEDAYFRHIARRTAPVRRD